MNIDMQTALLMHQNAQDAEEIDTLLTQIARRTAVMAGRVTRYNEAARGALCDLPRLSGVRVRRGPAMAIAVLTRAAHVLGVQLADLDPANTLGAVRPGETLARVLAGDATKVRLCVEESQPEPPKAA